jgi:hypothetical protein
MSQRFDPVASLWDDGACIFGSSASLRRSRRSPRGPEFGKSRASGSATGADGGRKRKGVAEIELASGEIVSAELHWYEATGIGRREFNIKRLL